MNRLDWYIARHVLGSVIVVALVVVGLDLLFAFVDELPDFNQYYGLPEALWYVAQTAPRQAYEQIPLCTLIGCLIGLGSLASSSELVVMRAAGISTGRIIGAVMKPTMGIMLFAFVLGQFVVPVAEQSANAYRTLTQSGGQDSVVGKGLWNREDRVFSHINAIAHDGTVFGVTRYEYDEDWALARVSRAYSGKYLGDSEWLLTELSETRFSESQTFVERKSEEVWKSGLTPARLSVLVIKPDYLSLTGLWGYTRYLKEQGLTAVVYEAAFWQKMLMPVGILGLVLVAVSFIFGPLRSVPMGQRLMTGVCVGLAFKLVQDMMGPASAVFALPPVLAVLFPIAISFILGGYLLKRAG